MKEESYGLFNQKEKNFLEDTDYKRASDRFTGVVAALYNDNINRDPAKFKGQLTQLSEAMFSESDTLAEDPAICVSLGGLCFVARKQEGKEIKEGGKTKAVMDPLREGAASLRGDLNAAGDGLYALDKAALQAAAYMETASKAADKAAKNDSAVIKNVAKRMSVELNDCAKKLIGIWFNHAGSPGTVPPTATDALKALKNLDKNDAKKFEADKKAKEKKASGESKHNDKQELTDADKKTQQNQDIADDKKEEKNKKKKFSLFKKKDKDKE